MKQCRFCRDKVCGGKNSQADFKSCPAYRPRSSPLLAIGVLQDALRDGRRWPPKGAFPSMTLAQPLPRLDEPHPHPMRTPRPLWLVFPRRIPRV